MSNLKTNMIYQTVYQVLAVALPLVTSPYLARVLGADGIGIYSYTYSIVSYFILFAVMGTASYGMRAVAQSKDKNERSRVFWEIYACQLATTVLSLGAYIVCCGAFLDNNLVSWCQILYLFAECVNINWLFLGMEKYKIMVMRNIAIKLVTLMSIFVFVRQGEDLYKYVIILAGGTLVSNAVLWMNIRKYINVVRITFSGVLRHVKPNFILFIPVAAASIYHAMDKTMLGMYSDAENSGYYYCADKLVNIPLTLVTSCCNVFMTRITSLFGQCKTEQAKEIQNESAKFGLWAVSAIAFGVAAVSSEFIPIFYGKGYEQCIGLVRIFAFVIIFRLIATHTRNAFLIPEHQDKAYTMAVCTGALMNLFVNYLLIQVYRLGALGATVSTLIAEASVCVLQIVCFGKNKSCKHCFSGIIHNSIYLLFGIVMYIILICITPLLPDAGLIRMLIKIGLGGVIYISECIVLWHFKKNSIPSLIREKISSN